MLAYNYLFHLSSTDESKMTILEAKVTAGLPDDAPRSQIYHWLKVVDGEVSKFTFVSMAKVRHGSM